MVEIKHLYARLAAALIAVALCAPPHPAIAQAIPGDGICGPFVHMEPEIRPVIAGAVRVAASDHAFGCMMWQSFIYLNWPAQAPGVPDAAARLGRPGPTVWETYKRHDEVFRADAAAPAPWGTPDLSQGGPRPLRTTHQTGGGMLIDRAGKPVYYEILINRDEFDYLVANRLYEATAQLAFAREHGIALPAGPSEFGPVGAIELKAAWKVLTRAELDAKPRRFHTTEAVLEDGARVTVGLVGLHLNQRVAGFTQGVWASFVQIDSAPLAGADHGAQAYSFYDPGCARCLVNASTEPPQSTQVEQVFPAAPSVREVNAYARALIRAADPDSPWQFYELLGVQWPQFALGLPTPVPDPRRQLPQGVPLSIGTPSTQTLMNPVLETFHQVPNVSCLGCHANGATAAIPGSAPFAADYSFLLAHAQVARP